MVAPLLQLSLVVSFLYVLFVLSLVVGLKRLSRGVSRKRPSVAIVVAARNEQANIRACLEALLAQDYRSRGPLEIVVVDDRSTDGTRAILEEYQRRSPGMKVVGVEECPEDFGPKKFALSRGIEAATADIICTTDADCVPPPGWVSHMVSRFEDDVGFVAGPSPQFLRGDGSGWLADFVYMESISGAVVSAGGIGWQTPWTCSGANLAYRKQAFQEVGGFQGIKGSVSGDDDLLMFLLARETRWRLAYALDPEAVVPGYEDASLRRLGHQRARRLSKFSLYPVRVQALALLLLLFYTAFFCLPVYVAATGEFLGPWLAIVGSRFAVELLAMARGARAMGVECRLGSFARAFLMHPVAIVVFGMLGTLGRFAWQPRPVESVG